MKAAFEDVGKFLYIVPGIVFIPKNTVGFLHRRLVPHKGHTVDGGVKPDLFADHVHRHISLFGYIFIVIVK